jgi:hypothetical protein
VFGVACLLTARADASIIFASATLGTANGPAVVIENDSGAQFALGVRFSIASTVEVTAIGGGVWSLTKGNLFGEIYALNGPSDLPVGDPLSAGSLARVSFAAPPSLEDVRIPLLITPTPGYYGLVFGAYDNGSGGGTIGPTANGLMTIDGTDLPGTSTSSYFEYSASNLPVATGGHPSAGWIQGGFDNARFVLEGTAVPEPGTFVPAVGGLIFLAIWGHRLSRNSVQ